MISTRKKHTEIVSLLLDHGADVDRQNVRRSSGDLKLSRFWLLQLMLIVQLQVLFVVL